MQPPILPRNMSRIDSSGSAPWCMADMGVAAGGGQQPSGIVKADLDPVDHENRPAEQEGTSGKGGVDNVLAQAAEEHLHQYDCKEVAQNDRPVGNGHGADEGQQHAGDDGGQVIGLAV